MPFILFYFIYKNRCSYILARWRAAWRGRRPDRPAGPAECGRGKPRRDGGPPPSSPAHLAGHQQSTNFSFSQTTHTHTQAFTSVQNNRHAHTTFTLSQYTHRRTFLSQTDAKRFPNSAALVRLGLALCSLARPSQPTKCKIQGSSVQFVKLSQLKNKQNNTSTVRMFHWITIVQDKKTIRYIYIYSLSKEIWN